MNRDSYDITAGQAAIRSMQICTLFRNHIFFGINHYDILLDIYNCTEYSLF